MDWIDRAQAGQTLAEQIIDNVRRYDREVSGEVYVVTGPRGFTERFDAHTVDVLVRLGLIHHVRDGHVIEDGDGNGCGPVHHFYEGPAER